MPQDAFSAQELTFSGERVSQRSLLSLAGRVKLLFDCSSGLSVPYSLRVVTPEHQKSHHHRRTRLWLGERKCVGPPRILQSVIILSLAV